MYLTAYNAGSYNTLSMEEEYVKKPSVLVTPGDNVHPTLCSICYAILYSLT